MKDKSQFQKELESGGIPFTDAQINYLYSKYQTDGRTIKKIDISQDYCNIAEQRINNLPTKLL